MHVFIVDFYVDSYDHLYHGENYDSRLELPGWDNHPSGFWPPEFWSEVTLMKPKAGKFSPQFIPPIRVKERYAGGSQVSYEDMFCLFS